MDALARLEELADRIGFGLWGVAPVEPASEDERARADAWLREGRAGEMAWLAETMDTRLDVDRLLPGARRVIVVADSYGNTQPRDEPEAGPALCVDSADRGPEGLQNATVRGRIARYAWGRDYHRVLRKKLHRLRDGLAEGFPGHAFRSCVDTAPLDERRFAEAAGLGWRGKHTLLIHPRHGSFVLLGAVVTTLELPTSEERGFPGPLVGPGDRCAHCTRCIDACPTGAIDAGGHSMDPRACISYLTIERRAEDPPGAETNTHGWLAGCDICQDVCPYNAAGARNPLPIPLDFAPRSHARGLAVGAVATWREEDRLAVAAGTSLTRIKLPMWKRNAASVAAHAGSSARERAGGVAEQPEQPDQPEQSDQPDQPDQSERSPDASSSTTT